MFNRAASLLGPALWLPLAAAGAQPQGAAAAVPAASVMQVIIGLAAVLALVAGCAWLFKRFTALPGMGPGVIRVLGGAALGQRERVVLVEIGGTWLVVGVAPGQVRTLHTMAKLESAAAPGAVVVTQASFAGWLRKVMEKNKHD